MSCTLCQSSIYFVLNNGHPYILVTCPFFFQLSKDTSYSSSIINSTMISLVQAHVQQEQLRCALVGDQSVPIMFNIHENRVSILLFMEGCRMYLVNFVHFLPFVDMGIRQRNFPKVSGRLTSSNSWPAWDHRIDLYPFKLTGSPVMLDK